MGAGSFGTDFGLARYRAVIKTADTAFSSTTPADAPVGASGTPVMQHQVRAGHRYKVSVVGLFQSAATTTGAKIAFTSPATTGFALTVRCHRLADSANGEFQGFITSSGDAVTVDSVETANADGIFEVIGIIIPSADGFLTLQGATEVGASNVTIRQGTVFEIWDLTP